ncbi:hypothetical protein GM668_27405 [Duganella ginsengisoli]|uniref:Uncharacterized protein n=1 Tax=Pseudoduganella ginsengisoli TaxID=1462440 RepID=A0A6L6Q872_9BURK|nr:hypothetical protein [Pseudoduganella ginsengisoli]
MCCASAAQPPATPVPSITVPNTRDPVDKSYRKMVRGMDRYARDRALAPQSTLRFRLLPRLPTVSLDGVALKVMGDHITLPVEIAPDHSFTLERNEQAWREDAALVANRKTSSMTWRAQVISSGVPEGMRRLGDLRLECLVGMEAGLISNNARMFAWLSDLLAGPDQVCTSADGNYLQFTERPLFGVTLRAGDRVAVLPFRALYAGGTQTPATLPYCDCQVLLDRSYYAPVWDRSWPDETLLEFDYMDEAPAAPPEAPPDRNAVLARLGAPLKAITFDSGYEVWQYQYPPARRMPDHPDGTPQMAELVLLFDAEGKTVKARRREP